METHKPKTVEEYCKWLEQEHAVAISQRTKTYYESVASKLRTDFAGSALWKELPDHLTLIQQEYLVATGYPLFLGEPKPELHVKSYDSFLLKTFRQNVLENRNWPNPPRAGWLMPNNWFERINDIARTLLVVKYLDGVDYIVNRLIELCAARGFVGSPSFEARAEGYYAAHFYIRVRCDIPKESWDTESKELLVEIQITTQLQEVIRKLLHEHYEKRRKQTKRSDKKWQWNYRDEEFFANYLGHILHYMEGNILEIRDKKKGEKYES
jgi:ppGpp synthetase/RelA/SpoT-type nucleotidyltranferase